MGTPISFKITSGETLVGTREFDQDIIKIGRLATAHLKLDDTKVSRIHAVIEVGAGKDVSIIDMGSAEGTFVNGQKVNKVRINSGDVITVGDTRLEVTIGQAVAADALMGAVAASLPAAMAVPETSGVFSGTPSNPPVLAPAVTPPPQPAVVAAPEPAAVPPPLAARPQPQQVAAQDDDGYEDDDEEGPYDTPPEPVPDASRAILELQVRWGMTLIEVQHHDKKPEVTIGPGGDVHLSSDEFTPPPKKLFSFDGSYHLHLNDDFTGFIRTGKGIKDIKSLKGSDVTLDVEQSGELQINNMVLAFRFTEPRRKVAAAPFGTIDYGWLNTFMTTIFMSAAFLATLVLYPQDTKSLEEELFQTNNRFTQFIINPEKKQKSEFLKKLEASKGKAGKSPARFKEAVGKMGQKDVPKEKQGRAASKEEIRKKNEEMVANKIAQMFGGGGGSSAVFGASSADALENAMGGISGREVGAAYGLGGLGERGHGPGGGGTSTSTFGVGKIGTRGRGGGNSGFGAGGGGLGGKADRDIDITQGAPVILGSLDKEIIRRVIRENIAQIKYCYERELTRTPGLNGKIQVKFVIGAGGNVQSAAVAETSMNNKSVESCITGKVRGWQFPKPKGGGIVIVTYPFIFKQGG